MKILLIDDEPLALKLLTRQLANQGFAEVVGYQRAHDALALLENDIEAASLIFCDLQMPEMDGIELVRHLGRIGYGGGLVLVSGEDERILKTAKELAKAHHLNMLDALHKPISAAQLEKVLGSQLSRTVSAPRATGKVYSADDLRRAIAGGELVNYYQPKVAVASGAVVGVETLVRWQHPEDGQVSPEHFIHVAEEHGLIDGLTQVVLANALRQALIWRNAGLHLSMAVNVSMYNLGSLQFPDRLATLAGQTGMPLASLVLEVTESQLMSDPLAVLDILTRLRLKHISLSIDDFGTGYSSLVQLRDIPFDELKIDQGFVHGAANDAALRAIFEASLGMARQLGMKAVAEGVEDRADWDFLRTTTCQLAQGYFIGRPMPAAALPAWIESWTARYALLADA